MLENYIGRRIKQIRLEIFDESQEDFAENINKYILNHHGKKSLEKLNFSQILISGLESKSSIKGTKLLTLINFLYSSKQINPSWILLENNNNQPRFSKEITIDQNLIDIQRKIKFNYEEMNQGLNDLNIVIENTTFR